MSAIPFHHYPLAPDDTSWDGPKEVAAASVDDLKVMCAWVEDGQEDKKGAYKLPHHLADSHKTVKSAVIAAGNALMGARGGVHGIPKDEIEGVKAHLEKHYHEFKMKAPWEAKAGRPTLYKSVGGTLKDVDPSKRTVTGYFASFNTLDSDGDVFQKGCFAKSLIENKARIMHLLQHDITQPIGRPNVLLEDATGLYFETTLADSDVANDTLQLYIDGVYNEHSVGFEMIKSEPDTDGTYPTYTPPFDPNATIAANVITEAKLWEGSTVTWGANQNTPFLGVKDAPVELVLKHISARNTLLHRGNLRDETYMRLEAELKSLQDILKMPQQCTSNDEWTELLNQTTNLKQLLNN